MKALSPRDLGKLALGGFFVAFAEVELKIGAALKAILKAEKHQQDLIIAAIGNFAAKANAVKAGLEQATTMGAQPGTDKRPSLSQNWIEAGARAMSKALSINDQFRVRLAHGHLEQNEDGSLKVTHLKVSGGVLKSEPTIFTIQQLNDKIRELVSLALEIEDLRKQLSSVQIVMPSLDLSLNLTLSPFTSSATASTTPTEIK